MANLYNEEIQKILIEVESGDLPDFSAKAAAAAKEMSDLREALTRTEEAMASMAAQGKKNSDEFTLLETHSEDLASKLKSLVKEQLDYANALDISQMSSKQLAERAKVLRQALNETSQAADPKTWDKLNDEYIKVNNRMKEVRAGTLRISDSMDVAKMSAKQLRTYAKQLSEQMEDIPGAAKSPEWQKLNKRLKDVKKQMGEVKESSGTLKSVFSTATGNLLSGFAQKVGSGIKQLAKDFVANSNVIGDRWQRTMTGMRKGYEAFLTALASGDWSHLFSKISKAYKDGRALAEMMEDLFEFQNATSITEASNNAEIARQTAIMRDTTRSNEERIAAAKEILRLENEIMEAKQKTAKLAKESAITSIGIKTNNRLDEGRIAYMIDYYFKNEEMLKLAADYMELEQQLRVLQSIDNYAESEGVSIADVFLKDKSEGQKIHEKKIETLQAKMAQMMIENEGLSEALKIQREYDLLNDEDISNYVQAQLAFINAQTDFERASVRAKTAMAQLRDDLKKEQYDAEIAKVDEWAAKERITQKQLALDRKITQEQLTAELKNIETERLRRINEVNQRFNTDALTSAEALLDNLISSIEDLSQAAATSSEAALDKVLEKVGEIEGKIQKIIKSAQDAADKTAQDTFVSMEGDLGTDIDATTSGMLPSSDDFKYIANLREKQKKEEESPVDLLKSERDEELAYLDSLYGQGLLAEEEYQKARKGIVKDYAKQITNVQMETAEEGLSYASNILNGLSSMVSSLQEAETASLEASMQKELAMAGNNAEKRSAIEEEYEAKKLELQKKYADTNMAIQIAQTLAAGALAIVQAIAQMGPIAGGIMAGVIAATTAAQVAVIVAQRNAIRNSAASTSSGSTAVRMVTGSSGAGSYSEGGFTGYGGRLEPAGIVHRGEYVVPMPEMRDPEAYAHVMAIERIRSRRSHRNPLPGFADGGYTGAPSGGSGLEALVAELSSLRENPIKAYVVLSDLEAQQSLRNKHLNAGSRS